METRFLCTVLAASLLLPLQSVAAEQEGDIKATVRDADAESVLDPRIERRHIKEADIDAENFEIGLYTGILSIEDFGSDPVLGVRLDYHLSEDVFLEGSLGRSKAGETSFETLNAGVQLLTDDEREYTYYQVGVGYNLLPGEAFLSENRAYNNALYLMGGAGMTDFAGDDQFTLSLGVGYRLLLNDWMAVRVDMKDHIFNLDVLGEDKTTHNLELTAGIGVFF